MSSIIKHNRYANENGNLITEQHTFMQVASGGFTLPPAIFPTAEGKYIIAFAGSPLCGAIGAAIDPHVYPLDLPLRPTVTELTENEFAIQYAAAKAEIFLRADSIIPASVNYPIYTDDDKIFLIDHYGASYQNDVNGKREWFNIVFNFDPVNADPRNP